VLYVSPLSAGPPLRYGILIYWGTIQRSKAVVYLFFLSEKILAILEISVYTTEISR